jgi:cyanophycin synthetase
MIDGPAASPDGDAPAAPSEEIEDSRRLTGPNLYSWRAGAVMEIHGPAAHDDAMLADWQRHARELCDELGWYDAEIIVRRSRALANLFVSAPVDVLMVATALNEEAWLLAAGRGASAPPHLVERLRLEANAERSSRRNLVDVHAAAIAHAINVTYDDSQVTIGSGVGARSWAADALPAPEHIPWSELHDVPIALVTGSNGKTTTTRLIAAMWRKAGRHPGWSCSDGVWLDEEHQAHGDYAGPAGAREVLRATRIDAAVLETARGGILRRGLSVTRADAAIITNISADHFGEYGVDSLDDLAEVKSVVVRVLGSTGCLVLDADDPHLLRIGQAHVGRTAWFSVAPAHPALDAHVAAGGDAGIRDKGQLLLHVAGTWHDLGRDADMPLTLGGAAPYNTRNLLGASLVAASMGVAIDAIRDVLHSFGTSAKDNPGRLQTIHVGGVTVLVDYAHNPDGLAALCSTAATMPARRRLLLLGQAGNRDDEQLRALARAASCERSFDRIIVKELPSMLRGRPSGDVPAVLREELVRIGYPQEQLEVVAGERVAVHAALAWAHEGDLLVCPLHAERTPVLAWLDMLVAIGWRAGDAVPE